jgi:hypothetical protein
MRIIAEQKVGDICNHHWARKLFDYTIVFTEMEPQLRTIRVRMTKDRLNTYSWQLPFLQFFFCNGYLGVAGSGKSYQAEHLLFRSPLPNVYNSGLVCQDMAADLDEAITIFFGSVFENPVNWNTCAAFAKFGLGIPIYDDYKAWPHRFCETWERLSKTDPEFILRVNWWEMKVLSRVPFNSAFCDHELTRRGSLDPFLYHMKMKMDKMT